MPHHSNGDIPWHALQAQAVLEHLYSRADGLHAAEAAERLERIGPNRLPPPPRRRPLQRWLAQFHNVLIYLLLAAAVSAAALGHWLDSAVIFAVVLINAAIGFLQEGKAERALEAIGRMLAPRARVLRDGHWREIDAEQLVPGDVVGLKAGDRVPADVRIIEGHGLRIDQAALTGESVPVSKRSIAVEADRALAERVGMTYAGCMVAAGQGTAVVVETAERTELGRISHLLAEVETLTTPLLRDIARFGRGLSALILILSGAMVALAWLLHRTPLQEAFLAGVAFAVAAIPEGLPAIITITLAIGVQRMASRKARVRRLPAVETLGAVGVICSDKTGTLTRNELVAERLVLDDAERDAGAIRADDLAARNLLIAAVLCNDAAPGGRSGDPIERALVLMAEGAGIDVAAVRREHPRLALLPFSSEHKFMATRHAGRACLKGAPEAILARCSRERGEAGERALDPELWHARLDALARDGYRVLAIAEHPLAEDDRELHAEAVQADGVLLGLVAFDDPPRPEVPAAIDACTSAGIAVKMITGDHAATALAIARQLGIEGSGEVLTGSAIDRLDAAALAERVAGVNVYARTTPEHKLRLVEALQARGAVVAMTGDGANDAPALKRADIGVAMGIKGTEAARQAAEIVLADDNFASIVAGVEEGRGVYDNIRKALLFILPTSAAQALVVMVAAVAGWELPITPVQILWVNMATAITLAMALAFEPVERNVMQRGPRPLGRGLITPFVVWRVAWVSALMTAGVFLLFELETSEGGGLANARTLAVNALAAVQAVYLFNARRWIAPGWTLEALFANRWAWICVGILVLLQAGFTYWWPAQALFGTVPLGLREWGWVAGVALVVFLAVELEKALLRRLPVGRQAD
jgi:calcium-translocating P-type ATPase